MTRRIPALPGIARLLFPYAFGDPDQGRRPPPIDPWRPERLPRDPNWAERRRARSPRV